MVLDGQHDIFEFEQALVLKEVEPGSGKTAAVQRRSYRRVVHHRRGAEPVAPVHDPVADADETGRPGALSSGALRSGVGRDVGVGVRFRGWLPTVPTLDVSTRCSTGANSGTNPGDVGGSRMGRKGR